MTALQHCFKKQSWQNGAAGLTTCFLFCAQASTMRLTARVAVFCSGFLPVTEVLLMTTCALRPAA